MLLALVLLFLLCWISFCTKTRHKWNQNVNPALRFLFVMKIVPEYIFHLGEGETSVLEK